MTARSKARGHLERAEEAAELIGRLHPTASVCVFGSLARGTSSEGLGDIDLLMVEPDSAARPTSVLRHLQPRLKDDPPLNLITCSTRELDAIWSSGAPIAFHLAREARILRDPLALLQPVLRREPDRDFAAAAQREMRRLTPYRVSSRFNGNLMACFAQVYSVGRTLVMLQLGRHGIWEFDRHKCFARLGDLVPERRDAIESIAQLEPFEAWRRHRGEPRLPFSPFLDENPAAESRLELALAAVDRLADDLNA